MGMEKEFGKNLVVDDLRVKRMKDQVMDTPQELDMERIKILMSSYKKTEGLPAMTRRARFFEELMTTKKLYIDENLFVGSMASAPLRIYAHPEWNIDWMKSEMQVIPTHLGAVQISDEQKEMYKEVVAYWDGKTNNDRANKMFQEKYGIDPIPPQATGLFFAGTTWPGGGGCLNYNKFLTKGVSGLIKDIEEQLEPLEVCKVDDQEKRMLFYENSIIVLKSIVTWANRYAELAREMADKEENPQEKEELLEIAQICDRVPENTPRSFREALQSVFFAHLAIQIEQIGCGNSFGFLGQYLEPFYQKDKEAGLITEDQAVYLFKMFYIKLQEIGYYFGQEFREANSSDLGQTITIGGITSDGLDATGELDYLMLDAQIAMKNIQPTFALMYHNNLKEDFLVKALDLVRTGLGQPQFMNVNVMTQRLMDVNAEHGITLAEARRGGCAGCVTGAVVDKTTHNLEGTICVAKPLELALNDGKDPLTGLQIGPKTGNPESFETFEELYDAFFKHLEYGNDIARKHGRIGCMLVEKSLPILLRSVLTDGCIESGKDVWAGGAKYNTSVYIANGAVDAANSLAAVKHLVFDEKKLTMRELLDALEANFEGHEKVQKMCLAAPKHGNDDEEMTALVRKVWDDHVVCYHKAGPCYMGTKGKPDAYSKSLHNQAGAVMGALPNGREARIAITDGSVSAMPGTDVNGPTALANSAAQAQDAMKFTSTHLNMKFHPSSTEGAAGTRNLLAVLKTFMDQNGSHIQFNSVDTQTLKKAQAEPEKYRDLVIRVAGFSAYYTCLDKGIQDEIIKRTELKMA